MDGLNIDPWMRFTFGSPYDSKVVPDTGRTFRINSGLPPAHFVREVSSVYTRPDGILDGLSPQFITGDSDSIRAVFTRVIDYNDKIEEPRLMETPVDFIFALSYSSTRTGPDKWELVESTWMEACNTVTMLVGPGKSVRFWVDMIDRRRRQNVWSFTQIYPYLVWPVVCVVDSFKDRFGHMSLRMWPAMEVTAGLVGRGLICCRLPQGGGSVFQTMVRRSDGLIFNQARYPSTDMMYVTQAFAAQVNSYRFRDFASFHAQAFVHLKHHTGISLRRNLYGAGAYGPLEIEEPMMVSGFRHEILASRWQPTGSSPWSNDSEWVPMELGIMIISRKEGEGNINPNFSGIVYQTGEHHLNQKLACISNEHGRKLMLLIGKGGGPHGCPTDYFRYPAYFTDAEAIRIAWNGPVSNLRHITRDTVQWSSGDPVGTSR